jgi:hypothetical protein
MTPSCRLPIALALAIGLLVSSRDFALAGVNAAGSASLSWDRADADTILTSIPSTPFSLFLHLHDAPDVRALAVRLIWTTNTVAPPCYSVESGSAPGAASSPDSLRGWTYNTLPGAEFDGDTTYTWTIAFDAADNLKDCVEYRISGTSCTDTAHAEFRLASVAVMDALGRIDTLATPGAALIAPKVNAIAVDGVSPSELPRLHAVDLTVDGHGFDAGSRVFLQRSGQRVEASEVAVLDSTRLLARVESPFRASGAMDLVVEHPAGAEARLTGGIWTCGALTNGVTLHRPTNDEFAYTQINFHDTSGASHVVPAVAHPEWPDSLISLGLLVVRAPGDTAALIRSEAGYGIGLWSDTRPGGTTSWAKFAIDPPQYATSLGTLVTSGLTFADASGYYADGGKPIQQWKWTYEDGTADSLEFRIGVHVRNWRSGQLACPALVYHSYYTARPSDPLVAALLPGPLYFYDFQEVALPSDKRQKRLRAVEVTARALPRDTCGDYLGTSALFGLAVWPQFKVANTQGDTVVHQTQNTGNAYGGYLYNGVPVGTRRTMNANACQISCISMLHNYHGVSWATPDSINTYLRPVRGGFDRELIASIVGVSTNGDTVYFTGGAWKSRDWNPGARSRFLIEHGPFNPIATVQVDQQPPQKPNAGWDQPAVAHVVARHQSGAIAVGDSAFTYRWPNVEVAGRAYSQNAFRIRRIGPADPQAAAKVESLLVRNEPVYVLTHSRTPNGWHFVVADGWRPAFMAADAASGTYSLQDPAYNLRRLVEAPFGNEFLDARYFVAATDGPRAASKAQGANTSGDGGVLRLLLSGVAGVTLTDPAGRGLVLPQGGDSYVSGIPEALGLHGWTDDDDEEGGVPVEGGLDVVEVETPLDGRYTLRVSTRDDANFSATVSSTDDTGLIDAASVASADATAHGVTYAVDYSAASGAVQLTFLSTTDAPPSEARPRRLSVLKNPSRSQVELVFALERENSCVLEFFDLQGRRIDRMDLGTQSAGLHVVKWNAGRVVSVSGVYFARLRAASEEQTVRFVLTR